MGHLTPAFDSSRMPILTIDIARMKRCIEGF
jgi:hypothetical protein